jgi:hypothetical protein
MHTRPNLPDVAPQDSRADAKTILAWPFAAAAWCTLVPIINVHFGYPATLIAALLSFVPMVFFMRGTAVLWNPELALARPHAVRLGSLAALVLLAAAPHSLKLAVANSESQPHWLPMALVGIGATIGYFAFALYRWRKMRSAT